MLPFVIGPEVEFDFVYLSRLHENSPNSFHFPIFLKAFDKDWLYLFRSIDKGNYTPQTIFIDN